MAMGFKDILSTDRAIFMNPEEFGEVHNVGGRSMTILIDDNEMIEREKRQTGAQAYRQGVYNSTLLFYVKAELFGKLPAVGRQLLFDGSRYTVIDAVDEDGIYSCLLYTSPSPRD